MSCAASSSDLPCGMPSRLKPPQPSPATLTLRPVLPSVVYSIALRPFCQNKPTGRRPIGFLVHRGSLATPARLELATLGLGNQCSIQLSYGALSDFSHLANRRTDLSLFC